MGIPGDILDCGLSAGAGGVFGLVGNLAAKTFGYLESKHAFLAKQAEWAHEAELLKLQAQWRQPEAESEFTPDVSRFDWYSFSATDERASCKWVDAARALVRPALTLGLSAVLALAFFSMASNDAARPSVIDSLVFATVTAIVWWFGDRAPTRKS
jgi:hypothetical protein